LEEYWGKSQNYGRDARSRALMCGTRDSMMAETYLCLFLPMCLLHVCSVSEGFFHVAGDMAMAAQA